MEMKKIYKLWLLLILLLITIPAGAQVAINDDGSIPNSNTILDVDISSNDKGILIPRLTTAQRGSMSLGSGDEGLTVYDTDLNTYCFYSGTAWSELQVKPIPIGRVFDGGIVFYVDSTGQHGLMASLEDLHSGTGHVFSNVTNPIGTSAQSMVDGASNTTAITSQSGHTTSAALLCENYSRDGSDDWYLPSYRELVLMFSQDYIITSTLENDGDATTEGLQYTQYGKYWSSTELSSTEAWYFRATNHLNSQSKSIAGSVRAIRAF